MSTDIDNLVLDLEDRLSREDLASIPDILKDLHPSDIGYITAQLDTDAYPTFIDIISSLKNLDEIIHELDKPTLETMVGKLREDMIGPMFSRLEADNVAEILGFLEKELQEKVLRNMKAQDVLEVNKLLEYEEDTAGRIMTPVAFSIHEDATVLDAFQAVKASPNIEMIYYLYVVDQRQHLIGVVSLRELLTKRNDRKMNEIMSENVISVPATMDQEEVAKLVERYDLAAIPVVDGKNKLVGIVTVDDIIDVIREEATEDILKLAGTNEEEFYIRTTISSFKRRMPWLLVSFFGGLITIQSMTFFTLKLHHAILLAFVPIIAGMGGNIGSQSATIIVRGLATGKILVTKLWEVVWQEILTGVALGLFFGTFLGVLAQVQFHDVAMVGIVVALGMFFSMIIAASVGSLMPMIFQRFQIDPAVATGPFVSTMIDNLGLLGYLGTALFLSHHFI